MIVFEARDIAPTAVDEGILVISENTSEAFTKLFDAVICGWDDHPPVAIAKAHLPALADRYQYDIRPDLDHRLVDKALA